MRKTKEEIRAAEQRELSVGMKRLLIGYRTLMEAALESEGLTLAQLRMLKALEEHPDISAAALARECYISPQSMQAVVTRAERAGWISRSAAPGNRRILKATLNPAGRRVLERGSAFAAEIESDMWADVKRSEMQQFNETLQRALERLQARLDGRPGRLAEKQFRAEGKTA